MRYKFEDVAFITWSGNSVQSDVSDYITLPANLNERPLVKCGIVDQANVGPVVVIPVFDQNKYNNEFALLGGAAEDWQPPAGTTVRVWWSAESPSF